MICAAFIIGGFVLMLRDELQLIGLIVVVAAILVHIL